MKYCHLLGSLCALAALSACAEPDFPEYNELEGFRVLALRATPPDLVPGDSTMLDALLYDEGRSVTRRWSLCPWPSDPSSGYPCLVDQALWDDAWATAGLEAAPALTLGEEGGTLLALVDDRAGLQRVCRELLVRLGEAATLPPDCDGTWNWTIRLAASTDDDAVDAILELPVLLQRAPERNQNPVIDGLTAGNVRFDASDPARDQVPLERDSKVPLRLLIAPDQSETYTPPRAVGESTSNLLPRSEALLFTWFVAAGETSRMRSTFREGLESLRKASENSWHTPKSGRGADWIIVVRDNRGGVDFVRGRAIFKD